MSANKPTPLNGALGSQLKSLNQPARLFLLAIIVDGIVYSGWSLFFNFYILERGFTREFLGMVNAIPSLAMLLFGVFMGRLSDRIGRKRAMVIGLVFSTLFMALEISVTQSWLILLTAFLGGVASPLYFLSQAPFMMKVSDEKNRTLLFSLSFGFVTLAGALGSLFAGQLPAFFGGWLHVSASSATAYQAVLLVSAFLSVFTLIPLLLIQEPKTARLPAEEAGGQPSHTLAADQGVVMQASLWQTVTRPITWKLSLPNLMIGSGAAILIPYMNLFFADKFKISDALLGILFALSSLLTGFGSLLAPSLEKTSGGKARAVVFTQAGSLVFLLLLGFSPWLGLAAMAFLMRGTLMNMAVPLMDAFAMEQVAEGEQGTLNSVRSLSWQVGWTVGPFISGIVQQSYGFTPLFFATAALYAGSITMTWFFFGRKSAAALPKKLEPGEEAPVCMVEISGD